MRRSSFERQADANYRWIRNWNRRNTIRFFRAMRLIKRYSGKWWYRKPFYYYKTWGTKYYRYRPPRSYTYYDFRPKKSYSGYKLRKPRYKSHKTGRYVTY
ncbi:hypothetical protein MSUIS_00780 [Mycoplasma suis KI3806]|uniref:Uncharacterized protein n=1 Tax=Mycoplasma suis (strain KI_3806) TaxID=708248 RepID=F0V2U9_MYCS3|nr:hypothetical protein [Mycoplasma suis]CBZ40171.1 hypothetical protein MSUIS_00780 [Mycoplasma suis KI3806]